MEEEKLTDSQKSRQRIKEANLIVTAVTLHKEDKDKVIAYAAKCYRKRGIVYTLLDWHGNPKRKR